MNPFVCTRGVTSSMTPKLKKSLSLKSSSSPPSGAICVSTSSVLTPSSSTRFAASRTYGLFIVMSTCAFLPLETITFGFANVLIPAFSSNAYRRSDISVELSVP